MQRTDATENAARDAGAWEQAPGLPRAPLVTLPKPWVTSAVSLRTLLAGVFLLLPLLAAGSASLVVAERAADDVRTEARQAVAASAAQFREQLEREMAQRWREMHVLAESLSLLGPEADADERRQRLERLGRSYPHYAWLGFASTDGVVVAATGRVLEGHRVADRPWFRSGLHRAGMQDVHAALLLDKLLPPSDEDGGNRFVDVAMPVLDAQGATIGVLGAHVSWSFARELERSVMRAAAPRRPELEVLSADMGVLLRPEGLAAPASAAKIPSGSSDAAAGTSKGPDWETNPRWIEARSAPGMGPQMDSGQGPHDVRADRMSEQASGFAASAPSLGWTVVARLDEQAALAPVRALREGILACGAGAAPLFALVGWLLAHCISRPLRILQAAAEEVCREERTALPHVGGCAETRALSGALGALMARRDAALAGLRSLADDLVRQVCERAAESVRTAEELRRSAAYLHALFQHAPFGLMVVSVLSDGRFRYDGANPAALRFGGFAADELVGREPLDVLPPAQAKTVLQEFRRCAEAGVAHSYDLAQDIPAGQRNQHVTLVPVHEPDGSVGRLLVCILDVTERNRLESELREAQRLDAVGRLAAGVAHDFNNLLQAVTGNLELLGAHVAGDRWADAYVAAALQSAERGARLTHQMLSFSRKQFLRARTVPVADMLDRIARLVGPTLGDGVELRLELPSGIPPLLADPAQLEAALLNVALNARDAMPGGGCMMLSAAVAVLDGAGNARWPSHLAERQPAEPAGNRPYPARGAPLELPAGRYIVLELADTGTGMDAATAAHAFEPFFTTKGVGKGSGLGLSMVQGFARQSGGEALIRSVPGQGTTIELWLPAAEQNAEPAGTNSGVAGSSMAGACAPPRLHLVGGAVGETALNDLAATEMLAGRTGMLERVEESAMPMEMGSRLRGAAWRRS